MNANRMISMVINMVVRRLMRAGVDAGVNAIANRRQAGQEGTPSKNAKGPNTAATAKRMRQTVRMARRF